MECHTERLATSPFELNTDKLFQGGNVFSRDALGLPPVFPAAIYTRNLTPDATGIQGWTAQMVRDAIKLGQDEDGQPLCPPMPAGPMGPLGNMTDEDALAIGQYLVHLAPGKNPDTGTPFPECNVPGPPPADGGADASTTDGGATDGGSDASPSDASTDAPSSD